MNIFFALSWSWWTDRCNFTSSLNLATWSHFLLAYFQDKAREKLVRANGGKDFKHGTVVWTSDLAKGDVIDRYRLFLPIDTSVDPAYL